jgi:HlyD family secretion protein
MRRLFRYVLVLGLIGGAIAASAGPSMSYLRQRTAPHYLTAQVSCGRVEAIVNSTGTVKPVRSVSIGAFASGPIAEVYVDFNSTVKEGDLLARIDPRLLAATVDRDKAALETQKADLARVEALLQQSKNNEARARNLMAINKDYLSGTEMDQFRFTRLSNEAQRKLALAMIAQAEANLKNSKQTLDYTEIRSPVSGIVIERKVDPGQTVAASFQTPELFVVAPDMDKHMHVFATVDEADIGLIRTAQQRRRPVTFTVDAYPHDLFLGQIYQVRNNGTTTQNVVTYPVVIDAKNPELKLMPGMTANLSFLIEGKDQVVRVPAAALRFVPPADKVQPEDRHYLDGSGAGAAESGTKLTAGQKAAAARSRSRRIVWVQEGDLLRAVPVTLGLMDNQFAELIEGDLEAGQDVVTAMETSVGGRP